MTIQQSKWRFESQARSEGYVQIAGVDEAGRGPLAGPLVVAACILPEQFDLQEIDDSKKLSAKRREYLYEKLLHNKEVVLSIEIISVEIIDQINIFQATLLGMQKAVASLKIRPDYVLVDGNKTPSFAPIPSKAIVQGDACSFSIGAASILAKVTRDRLLEAYEEECPGYGFAKHKGYPTKDHIKALMTKGPSPIHRRSFRPVQEAMEQI